MKASHRKISKVLISGPVGVGKTTAVQVASDVPILTTEALPTDDTKLQKPTTTVAMDFGVLQLDGGSTVHLYGTPGQKRFDFMWEILSGGTTSIILLADASDKRVFEELGLYLDAFASMVKQRRMVIGVTRIGQKGAVSLSDVRNFLQKSKVRIPALEADPRARHDVVVLVRASLAAARLHNS